MGNMYTDEDVEDSPLVGLTHKSIVLTGPIKKMKAYCKPAIMDDIDKGKRVVSIDAYRLIDIQFEQDNQFEFLWQVQDADFLVMQLGFGDPKNKFLPDLLVNTFDRRDMNGLPTWVLLGINIEQVRTRYNEHVHERLSDYHPVEIK